MRWVENISVRLSLSADNKSVGKIFRSISQNIAACVEEQVIPVAYRSAGVENDWSIHLYRNVKNGLPQKTRLGLTLAEELRTFGLVDHRIWIEDDR